MEEELLINEVVEPHNIKKATKFGNEVFKDIYFFYFVGMNALKMCFKMFFLQTVSG